MILRPPIARMHALAVILAAVCAGGGTPSGQRAPVKVILDTDIGTDIDDSWALGLAATSPEFELVAVTITDGDTVQAAAHRRT
jgi:purine nucleosidase